MGWGAWSRGGLRRAVTLRLVFGFEVPGRRLGVGQRERVLRHNPKPGSRTPSRCGGHDDRPDRFLRVPGDAAVDIAARAAVRRPEP